MKTEQTKEWRDFGNDIHRYVEMPDGVVLATVKYSYGIWQAHSIEGLQAEFIFLESAKKFVEGNS